MERKRISRGFFQRIGFGAWMALLPICLFPAPAPAGLESLFHGWAPVVSNRDASVCYIDSDPAEDLRTNRFTVNKITNIRARLEKIAGMPCFMVHYTQVCTEDLLQSRVKAVVFTAWKPLVDRGQAQEIDRMLTQVPRPTLSICGGFHLTYRAWGGLCSNMRRLAPGEKDPVPSYMPGYLKEWGWGKVDRLADDAIFASLPAELVVAQRHGAYCARLPGDFIVLAGSELSPVQVIRHTNHLLYGTQFHPELFDEAHPHGRVLLSNFFTLAGVYVR